MKILALIVAIILIAIPAIALAWGLYEFYLCIVSRRAQKAEPRKQYEKIKKSINKIKNECDSYAVYMDIAAFEAFYGKEVAGMVSTLYELFSKKEQMYSTDLLETFV